MSPLLWVKWRISDSWGKYELRSLVLNWGLEESLLKASFILMETKALSAGFLEMIFTGKAWNTESSASA